jgi:hypothetical protein
VEGGEAAGRLGLMALFPEVVENCVEYLAVGDGVLVV